MSWTYTGDPSDSDLDAVRFLVGDTDSEQQLASNEEILYAISQNAIQQKAAAIVCRAIAARFSTKASFSVGEMSKSCSDISKAFADRAKELEADSNWKSKYVSFSFGGISVAKKEALDQDTGAVQPGFKKGMLDNPLTYSDYNDE